MKGFWIVTLIIGFVLGMALGAFLQEKTTNSTIIKKSVFEYCQDKNKLDCFNQCKLIDSEACQLLQNSFLGQPQ